MVGFLTLFAFLFAVPASAATYDFQATWLRGDPFFEYLGYSSRYGEPTAFRIEIIDPLNPFERFQCGDLMCQYPLGLSLGADQIMGVVGTSSGQQAFFNVTDGRGTFEYTCDCSWSDPLTGRHYSLQSYSLELTEVPAPASLLLLMSGLLSLISIRRRMSRRIQ